MSELKYIKVNNFDPGLRAITISREKALNALNAEVLTELRDELKKASADDTVRVVVLTGAGEKAFIAGADIKEMQGKSTAEGIAFAQLGHEVAMLLSDMPKPTIAAVNGFALGGGTEMAIACDFILASENAVFGQPEVGLGIIPGFGGTVRLSKFVGLPRAKELIFSGRKVKADEAKRIGLANEVVPLAELRDLTVKLATQISKNSVTANRSAKKLLNDFSESAGLDRKLDAEVQEFGRLFGSHDQKEGMTAFVEKRKPSFEGSAHRFGDRMINNYPEQDSDKQMLIDQVRSFAQSEIAPKAAELDKTGNFPTDIVKQLGEMGLMGMMVPDQWGGAGMDTVSYVMAMEEVCAACASTGVIMSVNNSLVCAPITKFGNDQQKEKYLKPLATGQKLGAFALSEPGHGSDPAGLECSAKKVDGGYRISGTKNWITNGKEADYVITFASIDRSKKHKGICAFIVDSKEKGFQVSKLEDKLGIKASSTAQLFYDDVFVPDDALLGKEGEGFKVAMWTLDGGRIGIASQALGIARCSLDASRKFAVEREQFGAPLARLQAIQFFIADMATRLQGARLLTWNAARLKDAGENYSKAAAMAKLSASEASMWIATKAIQVHGGYGYTKEYIPERNFRDAKITEIYEGTSEIQRLVIAGHEFKELG